MGPPNVGTKWPRTLTDTHTLYTPGLLDVVGATAASLDQEAAASSAATDKENLGMQDGGAAIAPMGKAMASGAAAEPTAAAKPATQGEAPTEAGVAPTAALEAGATTTALPAPGATCTTKNEDI